MKSPRLVALDGGTYYHREALYGDRYRRFFDDIWYAPELTHRSLDAVHCLLVTDRINPRLMIAAKDLVAAFLRCGGFVVAMGETHPERWLPGIEWAYRPTNFWWWRTPGATQGLVAPAPLHSLMRVMTLDDANWHYHGVFTAPAGAEIAIALDHDRGTLLYDDRVTTPGRMLVTSLDPFFHHGSNFMPATTRFLDRFLPWLRAQVDAE
jgi:hypothetical protein